MAAEMYVPLLWAKSGELTAIQALADGVKALIYPLLTVPAIPWDFEDGKPAKSIEQHLASVFRSLTKAWKGPICIDGELLADEEASGVHPLVWLAERLHQEGIFVVPVTGPGRSAPYQAATSVVAASSGSGVCFRITNQDLANSNLADAMKAVLEGCHLTHKEADVVIDMKSISAQFMGPLGMVLRGAISSFPGLPQWRRFALAASSFPENLSAIDGNSLEEIQRVEWALWNALIAGALPRRPLFGDYGVSCPEIAALDPRIMNRAASVKYTDSEVWQVLKGRSVKQHGSEQSQPLCQFLVKQKFYRGPAFSWADAYIKACADGSDGPGNATTWVKVAVNHHLTLVAQQAQP